jgi:hypothetical protein
MHDPKKRLISAASFQDRVVHHALCNVIEPIFESRFIHDSYATAGNPQDASSITGWLSWGRMRGRGNKKWRGLLISWTQREVIPLDESPVGRLANADHQGWANIQKPRSLW